MYQYKVAHVIRYIRYILVNYHAILKTLEFSYKNVNNYITTSTLSM